MDWDKLRIFHAVAEAGSFTHAGESLNLSQSAVSRQISALEETLNVPLFHRHARGLILTEQGEVLYKTAHEVFAKLAMTEAQLLESKEHPIGPLKITTTVAFGSLWLSVYIKEFLEKYPEIDVRLILSDDELDLSMRQADVALRLNNPKQPDLIQRHLVNIRYKVYASAEYLKKHGIPKSPEDLDDHRIVSYGDDSRLPVENINWLRDAGRAPGAPKRHLTLSVNNILGIFRAVNSGVGIGALPNYMSNEATDLVEILPELQHPGFDIFFVYPEELRNSKRITVFRDFLIEKIEKTIL